MWTVTIAKNDWMVEPTNERLMTANEAREKFSNGYISEITTPFIKQLMMLKQRL